MNSLLLNPLSRPNEYYDEGVGDYVSGNPPDGSMEEVYPCGKCCDKCLPLLDIEEITLAISGVSLCGCLIVGTGTIKSVSQSLSIPGGTLTGGSGSFSRTIANAITHTRYTDTTCTVPYVNPFDPNPTSHDIQYSVSCSGGIVTIDVSSPSFGNSFFHAVGPIADALGSGLTNTFTSCNISQRGTGGTATISI